MKTIAISYNILNKEFWKSYILYTVKYVGVVSQYCTTKSDAIDTP